MTRAGGIIRRAARRLYAAVGDVARLLFVWDGGRGADASSHVTYIAIFALLLVGPAFAAFKPETSNRVSVLSISLPPTCMTQLVFGVECPGCGLTRAFVLITHGRFADSLRYHRLGIALYAFFLYLAATHVRLLVRGRRAKPPARIERVLPGIVIVLLLANWVAGIFIGSN